MYKYKTETFSCLFKSNTGFNEDLQELLDEYADDGWKLHTMQVAGSTASTCICVFEKKVDE